MADDFESTPFLADNDHDQDTPIVRDPEGGAIKDALLANADFNRLIKILTICLSSLSGIITALLITALVIIQVMFFEHYLNDAQKAVQALGTIAFISCILSTLMLFFQLPLILSFTINLILAILFPIYAGNILGLAWPGPNWCGSFYNYPYGRPTCRHLQVVVMVCMALSAGLGIFTGLLYFVLLLLRIVGATRSRTWETVSTFRFLKRMSTFPEGEYTLQLTVKSLKKDVPELDRRDGRGTGHSVLAGEQRQLIDT